MKKLIISIVSVVICCVAFAENIYDIKNTPTANYVDLINAAIMYDINDALVVGKVTQLLAQDIREVAGVNVDVNPEKKGKHLIIIGTIGQSGLIDGLIESQKLDASEIEGGWERFTVKAIDEPMEGVERALVIAGSDRRGTAYGVLALSEAIGVNPWSWWADVPVKQQTELYASAKNNYRLGRIEKDLCRT